jgi:hypothetical protein
MTTPTYAIPADEQDLLGNLRIADKQHQRPDEALADETQLARARAWLSRLLVDFRAREVHTDWLCEVYQAKFRPPLLRRLCDGLQPPQPATDLRFNHHTLLAEPRVDQVLKDGVNVLPAEDVGAILLNPYALWDLADRIDNELPQHWLPLLDQVGQQIMRDWDIELQVPGMP